LNPKITLIGRIGQDPEPIGSGIRFRMATNDRIKNAEGEWEDRDTSWFTVKAWKTLAEQSKGMLKKGQEVIVVGVMREENWTDNNGSKRTSFEVVAESVGITTKTLNKGLVSSTTEPDPWTSN
jgi:single-strand DNA-binding protein